MNWLARLLRKQELERRLDRELRFHFDCHVDDLVRSGLSQAEARRQARIEFGGMEQIKEECRDSRGVLWLETALADMRYAARAMRRNPVFAVTAIGTLALGIGATTAIFSILNAVFLRPLPYFQPERLVWATKHFPNSTAGWPFLGRDRMFTPEYAAWRKDSTAFERLEAYGMAMGVNLGIENRPAVRVRVGHVTPGFFTMLGVKPRLGRTFAPGEDAPQRNRVVLISDALWRNGFQADPDVLGKAVTINGASCAVIGVMPAGFIDPEGGEAEIWRPDAVGAAGAVPGRAMRLLSGVIGRLKPGESAESARANLAVIAGRMVSAYPPPWSRYHAAARVRVVALQEHLTAGSRTALFVLMGAVACILLIACANVANMFLSRTVARRKEIALRAAIGASRFRMIRLLLAESVLLALCGGLAGIALMYASRAALGFLLPAAIPPDVPVDARVLGFAAFCSLAASILFGLAPALAASRPDLNTGMKEGGTAATRRRRGFRFREALAAAQVAISVVLLIGAGLLIRSFHALTSVNPGFDSRNVLLAEVSLAPAGLYNPERQVQYFGRALDAIESVPGVRHAALTDQSPLQPFQSVASGLSVEGGPEADATVVPTAVSAGYFHALGIPLVAGRLFDHRDGPGTPKVAIVNRALARVLFANLDPVGRRIRFGEEPDPWVTVVGVVADLRHRGFDDKVWPKLYQPYTQTPAPWMSFVIKASGDPSGLAPAVRQAVAGIDRNQPLFNVESLEQRLSNSVLERRQRAALLACFAVLGLFIAVLGIYGVMAYSVARRTHEMGIRMALGGEPAALVRMLMSEGMRMTLAGAVLGVAGAVASTRVLSTFLYGVSGTDSATFVSVCLLMFSAACIAIYVPARRATRVDPLAALRQD